VKARPLCNTVYWFALTTWIAVIVAAGVAAGFTFTVLPALGLTIESYSALPASEHGQLAAGKVMEPLFAFVDIVQIAMAFVVVLAVVVQVWPLRYALRRVLNAIRVVAILVAVGLLAYRAITLTPEMNRELRAYWSAAEAGDVEKAQTHREAFTIRHPRASDLFSATLATLVVALLVSPAALAAPPRTRPEPAPPHQDLTA